MGLLHLNQATVPARIVSVTHSDDAVVITLAVGSTTREVSLAKGRAMRLGLSLLPQSLRRVFHELVAKADFARRLEPDKDA